MILLVCSSGCVQVVDILKTSGSPDLFSPELEYERKKHGRDPDPGLDLLGALLAVRK